ncbi:putative c2h2 type zinc finger domain-containing protein [Neofusicoccum parvum UCRNP2]|uniref:Putative c2h2 type zinc finger domain-containing protein n=1 Tax=Botryosphaeria parva (strain UCR-NP2) TaxID=1287680 RepID=R1G976_BOTPV|nr:putative c2h2 type zinc finger domain-containing protein [Neofusicoccum parvum UCRNP2]
MPPTESARQAALNFFCDLCNKGYQRHNDYEAHISSYDHQHKKESNPLTTPTGRLKDMRVMSKDPEAAAKARKDERARDKEAGLVKLDLTSAAVKPSGGGGFKKGGFKSAFGDAKKEGDAAPAAPAAPAAKGGFKKAFGAPVETEKEKEKPKGEEKAVEAGDLEDQEEIVEDEDLGPEPPLPTGCRDPGCQCHNNFIPQTLFVE